LLHLDILMMTARPNVLNQVRGAARRAHGCCCICGLAFRWAARAAESRVLSVLYAVGFLAEQQSGLPDCQKSRRVGAGERPQRLLRGMNKLGCLPRR
jgi:hypothetical protein